MDKRKRIEILEKIQGACNEITQGYQEQTGNTRIRVRVLQLINRNNSRLQEGTDIIRKAAALYDEYEGNEEYIHIPDVYQMKENFENHIVIGIEDIETGELEGVTTIKYYENKDKEINPYYPKKDAKYYEVTGVIIKQKGSMQNRGLGTAMYESCFLGIQCFATEHPDEHYKLNIVIDCTNIKSLYAAQNAVNNINARGLLGKKQKMDLHLGGLYIVRDVTTKAIIEAPTFVIESSLQEENLNSSKSGKNREVVFAYKKPKKEKSKNQIYTGLAHSVLRRVKQFEKQIEEEGKETNGYQMVQELLKNLEPGDLPVERNLDEGTGYVEFIDFSSKKIAIEDMRLKTNSSEEVGTKRIPRKDVGEFIGPMPDVTIKSSSIEEGR